MYVTRTTNDPLEFLDAGLSELSESTGGLHIYNGNDLYGGFQKLKLPDAVYILGISLTDVKTDGSVHRLKVIVKDPRKLTVCARKSYTAPKQ